MNCHQILIQLKLMSGCASSVCVDKPEFGETALTAHQIDREVSFEITMTFIIENVTLDYTKNNEKSWKKIHIALFEKIDLFDLLQKIKDSLKNNWKMVIFDEFSFFSA